MPNAFQDYILTIDRINDIILEIYSKLGLHCNNFVATVTDNGSNFVKAFKEFGIAKNLAQNVENSESSGDAETLKQETAELRNDIFENSLPKHIKCATHTLRSLASTDLAPENSTNYSKHENIMQKFSNLWSKINRHKTSEQIVVVLGCQLKYPVATRWNSLHDSIEDIIKHKDKINELYRRLELQTFFDPDFVYLEDFAVLLTPISEAIDFLQKEKGMFYGYLLLTLATITKYRKMQVYNTLRTLPLEMVIKIKKALVKRFHNYFHLTQEVDDAIVASVLCPSAKLKWISAFNASFNDKIEEISSLVKKNYLKCNQSTHVEQHINESPTTPYFDFSTTEQLLEIRLLITTMHLQKTNSMPIWHIHPRQLNCRINTKG